MADFIGEGLELEAPVHVKVEGERTYAAILQPPPYHIDYIPVPWEADQTPKLTNFTYAPALKSTYSHKTEGSTAQDLKFDMKSSVEEIEALGVDSGTTQKIKTIAGFALGKAGVKDSDKILGALVDKVDKTKTETDKTSQKMVMSSQMETSASDRVLFYTTAVHIWRYPIKNPAPSWLFNSLIEGNRADNGDKFLTFTIADEPAINSAAGLEDDSYQHLHEEGNLFSYPTSLAQIEGYTNKQLVLTQPSSIVYSPGSHTQTITVTSDASKATTESKTVKYGTISKVVGTAKVLSSKSTENSSTGERGNTSTFTKIYSTTDTLTASFPNPQGDYANVTFTTNVQASDVEVSLGYRDEEKTEVTAIGKTSVKIGGWQAATTSNNEHE